jgi:hypothetical protein
MIELPQTNARITRQAMTAANQLLVNKNDYGLVQALLNQGKTVRFRIKCAPKPATECAECLRVMDKELRSVFLDWVYGCLEDKIEPCALMSEVSLACLPMKGEIDVFVKPSVF